MAQTSVNFRMDEQLKKNVEEICQKMGMSLTTALTIFCRKVEQERKIPFEVTAEASDPFYDQSNPLFRTAAGRLPGWPHEIGRA